MPPEGMSFDPTDSGGEAFDPDADFERFSKEEESEKEASDREAREERERAEAEAREEARERKEEESRIQNEKDVQRAAEKAKLLAAKQEKKREKQAAAEAEAEKQKKEIEKNGALWGPAAGLALTAAPRFAGWGAKKAGQAASGFLTSIERWADAKLNKHPIARKIVGVAALPLAVMYGVGFWTGLLTAPLTGFGSHKLFNVEAQKSWAEQEAEEAGKKPAAGGGGGGRKK